METLTDEYFERLVDLHPSAKLVFLVIEQEGPITLTELADRTLLSQQTIRSAVQSLEEFDLIQGYIYPYDARKKMYRVQDIAASQSD